jgi:hypothetical protein
MKVKIFFSWLIAFLVAFAPTLTYAQHCDSYYMLSNNSEYELLNYDKKDNLTGKVQYKVTAVNSTPAKTEAVVHSKIFDDKGKMVSEGDFTVNCQNGIVSIDMRSMMNQDMMKAYPDMEVKMHGDFIDYPTTLTSGQKLKDVTYTIDVLDKNSGQALSSIIMNITGRTVGSKENVAVPAGNYSGYKINQDMEVRTKAMGVNMPASRLQTVEYFVPGLGMVRSETYRNGKLMSYSVLNKVAK